MIVCRDQWRQVVDYLTSTIVSPSKLFLQQLAHLTPELLIRNLPNRRVVLHFGECEYYCRGGSECEQRHVFDTYVRDCVSARIRHDVQECAITRYCRWNRQHAVPGASRGVCRFFLRQNTFFSWILPLRCGSSQRFLSAVLLERWPQVCRVKVTFTKLLKNCFVSTTKNSMKYVVNWIPLRIRVRSRNTQPYIKE